MMKHAVLALWIACVAATALGDVVYLRNGGSLEGQVVPTEDGVVVKLPAGEVRIAQAAIARIEKKPTALDEYQKRALALKQDDAEAQAKLGAWALSVGLKAQATEHFRKAIALDPNHANARQALGYRRVAGKWVNEDEEMRARGLVRYEGQWMAPEAAAKLQALKTELELAREKRRAAEAELQKARQQAGAPGQTPPTSPYITTPNPYDYYYSTRDFGGSRTHYYVPPSYIPYYTGRYTGRYGMWWYYPGGRRYLSPSRHHRPRHRR